MPPSAHSARADLERLRGASGTAGDASPFRTAMRNIIAACRNSPLALASYCQQGVLPALAAALQQPQVRLPLRRHLPRVLGPRTSPHRLAPLEAQETDSPAQPGVNQS